MHSSNKPKRTTVGKGTGRKVPSVRRNTNKHKLSVKPRVVVIAVGDMHLSAKAPSARSAEKNWFAAMKRQVDQLIQLREEHPKAVFLYLGDIYHTSREPHSVTNFAIRHLPKGYSIYGQHDMLYHNTESLQDTPYWTLVETGDLKDVCCDPLGLPTMKLNVPVIAPAGKLHKILLYGFPWNTPLLPTKYQHENPSLNIAMIHSYVWKGNQKYTDAPVSQNVSEYRKRLKGYDFVLCGDNHRPFADYPKKKGPIFINCGCFLRRRMDEKDIKPRVWLIREDKTVFPHFLDTSKDKWAKVSPLVEALENARSFEGMMTEVSKLKGHTLDFVATLRAALKSDSVRESVKEVIQSVLKEVKSD